MLTDIEIIDMYQEAFNNMVFCYHREFDKENWCWFRKYPLEKRNVKEKDFCFATFLQVFNNSYCRDDMCEQIRQLEPFLEFIDHDTELMSHYQRLLPSHKYGIIDRFFKTFDWSLCPEKIDCMELDSQVCDFCWMTEYSSLQQECNACPDHVDILEINVKLFQEMMVQHNLDKILYDFLKIF